MESGGGISEEYVPRTQEELDRLASLVKGAIGFDSERNDVFEIENVEFLRQKYEYSDGFFTKFNFNMILEILFKVFLVIAGLIILMKFKKAFWHISIVQAQFSQKRAHNICEPSFSEKRFNVCLYCIFF